MKTPELKPETVGIEKTLVVIDRKTGIKTILREIGGEPVEVTLKDSENHMVGYINFEELSKLKDEEQILKMMGFEISPAITELIQKDEASKKYYIKFLPQEKNEK